MNNDKPNKTIDTAKVREFTASVSHGNEIFQLHCTPCHVNPEIHAIDANTFDKIFERYPSPGELYFTKYIQNSKALKKSGDLYAIALDKYNSSDYEHLFIETLTDHDIQDLIIFIKSTYY
jgi:hypothetical protein